MANLKLDFYYGDMVRLKNKIHPAYVDSIELSRIKRDVFIIGIRFRGEIDTVYYYEDSQLEKCEK